MYRYLLLDFDNTLLDFNETEQISLRKTFATLFQKELTAEDTALYHRINDGYWKRLERKEVTRDQLKEGRFKDFIQALGLTCDDVMHVNKVYMDILAETVVEYPETEDACRRLAERYKLYVITNGTTYIQKARFAGASFHKYMEGIVISDEIGVDKPDPRFFEAVVQLTGDPDVRHYLVVGDSLSSDIRFGKNIGADTCRIGEPTPESDLSMPGMKALADYLTQKTE